MNDFLSGLYNITFETLYRLWSDFLVLLPRLAWSLLVFVVGLIIGKLFGRLLTEVLRKLKVSELFNRGNWDEAFNRAGIKMDISEMIGQFVKWVIVLVFLLAAIESLGLIQFASFLAQALSFLPDVFVAVLIFVAAVILSEISQKVATASMQKAGLNYAKAGGMLAKTAIMVFAVLAILAQLGIARNLVLTLFTGFVGALALAFGLAFGLGGKDVAAEILRDIKQNLR